MKVKTPKGWRLLRWNQIVREADRRICASFEPGGSSRLKDTMPAKMSGCLNERPGINGIFGDRRLFIRRIKR